MFKEIIIVYSEKHTKPIIQNTVLLIVKIAGTIIASRFQRVNLMAQNPSLEDY
jgi:hypothetical protein